MFNLEQVFNTGGVDVALDTDGLTLGITIGGTSAQGVTLSDERTALKALVEQIFTGLNAITPRPTSITASKSVQTVNINNQSIVRDTITIAFNRLAIPGDFINDPV